MKKIWFLVEQGLTGTENQLRALEEGLRNHISAMEFEETLKITWHHLQRGAWIFPRMDAGWYWDGADTKPDLVIAAGRLALWPSLDMKARGARVVFIQDPRWFRHKFDHIYAPRHDGITGAHITLTDGALTSIKACQNAPDKNKILLVIGGARKGKPHKDQQDVLDVSFASALENKTILLTFSRRTPEILKHKLRKALPNATIYDPMDGGDNPYLDWLCSAEVILVTDDSVSMISEAASTGRAVYILPYLKPKGRLRQFMNHIVAQGSARFYDDVIDSYAPETILNDTEKVAKDIVERFLMP